MRPFTLSKPAKSLKADFLQPPDFVSASKLLDESEISGLLRRWVMEGTPYVFSDMPLLYEVIRAWLSSRLGINALEIKVIGSARTGFSMAPPPDFGNPFHPKSDLDIAVVSTELFSKCKLAFELWKTDYETSVVSPANPNQRFYWDQNIVVASNSIERGFVDPNKIPTFDRYSISQRIANSMWLLKNKLDISASAPTFRKATIRVYKTWHSFHKQVKLNFERANVVAANST